MDEDQSNFSLKREMAKLAERIAGKGRADTARIAELERDKAGLEARLEVAISTAKRMADEAAYDMLDRCMEVAYGWEEVPSIFDRKPGARIAKRLQELAGEYRRRWRHRARGSSYIEVGRGYLQASTYPPNEGDELVAYRGVDGKLWFRAAHEFEDGRFAEIVEPMVSRNGR